MKNLQRRRFDRERYAVMVKEFAKEKLSTKANSALIDELQKDLFRAQLKHDEDAMHFLEKIFI